LRTNQNYSTHVVQKVFYSDALLCSGLWHVSHPLMVFGAAGFLGPKRFRMTSFSAPLSLVTLTPSFAAPAETKSSSLGTSRYLMIVGDSTLNLPIVPLYDNKPEAAASRILTEIPWAEFCETQTMAAVPYEEALKLLK